MATSCSARHSRRTASMCFFSSGVAKSMSKGENFHALLLGWKACPSTERKRGAGKWRDLAESISRSALMETTMRTLRSILMMSRKWALVIDGKVAPYRGGDPQWSADSQHLYTTLVTSIPGTGRWRKPCWMASRLCVPMRSGCNVAPQGNMLVAEVYAASNTPQPLKFMVVNGKKVPGTEIVNQRGANFDQVTFSPDGKHFAAQIHKRGRQAVCFFDGKRATGLSECRSHRVHRGFLEVDLHSIYKWKALRHHRRPGIRCLSWRRLQA